MISVPYPKRFGSTKMQSPERTRSISFLDLPGELRNRIYYFLIAELRLRIHVKRKSTLDLRKTYPFIGQDAPLIHLCRLTRQEFSPLYFRRKHIWVRCDDIGGFQETFAWILKDVPTAWIKACNVKACLIMLREFGLHS